MDVRINTLRSNIHLTDARAMLTPEVLQQIVEAVALYQRQEAQRQQEREQDMRIERRSALGGGR